MPTTPYTIDRFGGLRLLQDQTEVGSNAAVDMLNADLDRDGRVRCRDGYAKFTSSALAGDVMSVAAQPATGVLLAWAVGGTYYALTAAGAVSSSINAGGGTTPAMWLVKNPVSIATLDTAGHVISYNSASDTWANVDVVALGAVSDTWSVVGVTPTSDRTVLAGGSTNPDRVTFSDPGGAAWTSTSWVEFSKWDSDPISGVANYRDRMIVFKGRKFAVFTGETLLQNGSPVFNYFMVDTGVGLVARLGVAKAAEGVYFVGKDGIYLTQGDRPTKVSGALDPLFRGTVTSPYAGSAISQQYLSQAGLTMYRERLYFSVATGASTVNNRLFVFDPASQEWTVWDMAAGCLCVHKIGSPGYEEELMFGYATGTNDIGRHFRTQTTDAGSAISWSYTSGMYSPANDRGRVAVSLESQLLGSGTVTLQVATTGGGGSSSSAFDTGSAITLGTAPAIAEGWQQIDREGAEWQHKLSGSGAAVVSGLTHFLSFVKPSGVW